MKCSLFFGVPNSRTRISHQWPFDFELIFVSYLCGRPAVCASLVFQSTTTGEKIKQTHTSNEQPTHYVTITTRRNSADTTDSPDVERVHLKKIVGQLKNNLYNVSVLSEPDLEMITNMDPNSVADITGKDFIEQLKEVSGRLGGGKSNLSWDLSPYIPSTRI